MNFYQVIRFMKPDTNQIWISSDVFLYGIDGWWSHFTNGEVGVTKLGWFKVYQSLVVGACLLIDIKIEGSSSQIIWDKGVVCTPRQMICVDNIAISKSHSPVSSLSREDVCGCRIPTWHALGAGSFFWWSLKQKCMACIAGNLAICDE